MNTLDIARHYLSRGWKPVPIPLGSKSPVTTGWGKMKVTLANVAQHFNGADQNIGVQFGEVSGGLADVDLDCPEAIRLAPRLLPKTDAIFGRASKPASHYLFVTRATDSKASRQFRDADRKVIVELRMGGGGKAAQTLFPGSIHPSGEALSWVKQGEPAEVPFAQLMAVVTRIAVGALLVRHWPSNDGHEAALRVGGFLARSGWEAGGVADFVGAIAHAAGDEHHLDHERTARDAAESHARGGEHVYGFPALQEFFGEGQAKLVAQWLGYRHDGVELGSTDPDIAPPFSESAIALAFAERYSHELRFVDAWGRWMLWNGTRWEHEKTLLAFDFAHRLCREAAQVSNKNRARIAAAKTTSAVVSLARADRRLAATVDQWDADPWLLNTPDGVVDLRTGETRPGEPEDFMTKITAVAPDKQCSTDLWLAVLRRAMNNDNEMVTYLQRLFGYALTGVTIEEIFAFFHGEGANSKTKIVEAVSGCMGDYHKTTSMETFLASRNERHPTEIADLCGARLVTAVETDEGRRWDAAKIKALTGGDEQSARFMRKDFFTFHPQFKPMVHGNKKPKLRSIDEAMRRRLHLVPFEVTIPKEQRDIKLGEKLKAEWPGILAWMIEGCIEWQRIGLNPPTKVTEATEAYFDSQDAISRWIEECCVLDPNKATKRGLLWDCYKNWAQHSGEYVGRNQDFYEALEKRGLEPITIKGERQFRGITIPIPDRENPTPDRDPM